MNKDIKSMLIKIAMQEGQKFKEQNGRNPTEQEAEVIRRQIMTAFNLALISKEVI